ncbi:nucleoside triphosphatase YtkD [Bacillus sp. HMF5848]|uniref:RNA deprotection pyrophosphohydrolase n=1 Tax=Bacillus sp. HMF5848 TaxID=2495421 RepID=UPI000F7B927F|nr:nucleoside triphosphatase YtkD [Bacillus sp. HMF5848]RSK28261.1 nucleoside triphosphatase YtkD [Bacillus sp. HMF5848]
MIDFVDYYQNKVVLSFEDHPFSEEPKHVWVVCRYDGRWLLTHHKDRGLEFPGGKVEQDETAEQAAIREVYEETGGQVKYIRYVGQYKVLGKDKVIVKNIYFADIESILDKNNYLETNGPVLLTILPEDIAQDHRFSFIMKDNVLSYTLQKLALLQE